MANKVTISYRTIALFSLGLSILTYLHIIISAFSGKFTEEVSEMIYKDIYLSLLPIDEFIRLTIAISILFTFIFTFLLYVMNFKILNMEVSKKKKAVLMVFTTFLLPAIFAMLSVGVISLLSGADFHILKFKAFLSHSLAVAIIVDVSVFFIDMSKRKQQMVMNYEMLKTENAKAKYEALKSQIDPHFLFNSLNTLHSLIDVDTVKAKDYVRQLSQVFRCSLQKGNDVIALSEEIYLTKSYCALMQIRYGSSLTFVFNVADESLNSFVIHSGIQTLVENAVKHNIINKRQPLAVTISTSDDRKRITVSNPVQRRKEQEDGEGIGLANLAERYRLKWQKEILIRESENKFSVTIPLIDNESNNN